MTKFVALIRGVGPENPNMHHEPFWNFFEGLGFKNVQPVISSGNVVFETDETDTKVLEEQIEKALPEMLGFSRATIVRSEADLRKLTENNPFRKREEKKEIVWNITFLKNPLNVNLKFPYKGQGFELLQPIEADIPNIINLSETKTPKVMSFLEKTFGKEMTMRTWKTVQRILAKMS